MPILPPGTRLGRTSSKGKSGGGDSGGGAGDVSSSAPPTSAQAGTKVSAVVGPKRPPPQVKANKLAELYQAGGGGGAEPAADVSQRKQSEGGDVVGESGLGVVKDKSELQTSIRSLKENNEALIDINKNLEQKLFKVSLG